MTWLMRAVLAFQPFLHRLHRGAGAQASNFFIRVAVSKCPDGGSRYPPPRHWLQAQGRVTVHDTAAVRHPVEQSNAASVAPQHQLAEAQECVVHIMRRVGCRDPVYEDVWHPLNLTESVLRQGKGKAGGIARGTGWPPARL
jgi:hypothetical protein